MDHNAQDFVVVSSLISAPAWVPSLSELNIWLTTLSLCVGILLGLLRLYSFLKDRHLALDEEDDL